jgi:hypothetical protein
VAGGVTAVTDRADLAGAWRSAPYAFVHVDEVGQGADGATMLLAVAIAGRRGEPPFLCRIDVGGSLHRQAPRRLDDAADGPEAVPPRGVCPELAGRLRDRVAVVHGTSIGWRLLVRTCPQIRPFAVLDSLGLARALLPGGRTGLTALAKHLEVPLTVAGAGSGAAIRNAVTLARVFERLVDTMSPTATLDALLSLGGNDMADPFPDLGLENGP